MKPIPERQLPVLGQAVHRRVGGPIVGPVLRVARSASAGRGGRSRTRSSRPCTRSSTATVATFATANSAVQALEGIGLLEEINGGKRNRVFRYSAFLTLFADVPDEAEPTTVEVAEAD